MKTLMKLLFAATLILAAPLLAQNQLAGSITLNNTGGNGYVQIANQSAAPATPTSAGRIYFDSTNRLSWRGNNTFTRTFDGTANTANRIYTLPDAAIVMAGSASALTSGRVPYATTGGILLDDSAFTYATGGNLTVGTSGKGVAGNGGAAITFAAGAVTVTPLSGQAMLFSMGGAGLFTVTHDGGSNQEVARFTAPAGDPYITVGNGTTSTTGGAIQWDDTNNWLRIGPHGDATYGAAFRTTSVLFFGVNTVQFGATAAATIGVSADTTAGVFNFIAPSAGSFLWKASGGSNAMTLTGAGALTLAGTVTSYNGIATAGNGVASIQGAGRVTAQSAANASVATYTVGASDASFLVSANINVTTSSAEAFTVTCTYTDETNTSRIMTFNFQILAGTIGTAINFANGAVPYEGVPNHIRCKASTAITIKTAAGGTYTGCTYNAEGVITKLQ